MKQIFYASVLVLLFACGNNSNDRKDGFSETAKNAEDSLFQDVMDEHDEAMSRMGKIAGYRKQVAGKLDSLNKAGASSKASIVEKYEELGTELKQAEDRMNTWMHEFSIDSAQDDTQRRLQYLESEKSKVSKVKEEILAAVAKADSLLRK